MNSIEDFHPEAVVIDAGKIPEASEALHWLDECDRIVCCDGAANKLSSTGRNIWRIVGDCDSLAPEILDKYADIIRKNPDQETNDQTKAIRYLLSKGIRRVVILGATGLREDHTLGNISLIGEYLRVGVEARIYTDYGVFIPCEGRMDFFVSPGSQVSIFNIDANGMRSEGLKYPLRDFDRLWQGTLNECEDENFRIDCFGRYLVFIAYPR